MTGRSGDTGEPPFCGHCGGPVAPGDPADGDGDPPTGPSDNPAPGRPGDPAPGPSGNSAPGSATHRVAAADSRAGDGHGRCRAALRLEPPRYCDRCRRRMVVQVVPTGWTARCVEHGTLTG